MHYSKMTRIDIDTSKLVAFFQHNYQFFKDIFMDKEVPSLKHKYLAEKIELGPKNISCMLNSDVDNDSVSTNRTMETMSSISDESKPRMENESGNDIKMENEDGSDTRVIRANDYSEYKIIRQRNLIAKVGSSEANLENSMIVSATEVPDENSHTTSDASSENEVEHGTIIHYHSDSSITTVNSDEEFQRKPELEHQLETKNTSQPQDGRGQLDSFSISSVSCRTTFLGQEPYSGSISLRSNSSTASSHSFAFPILASEWNGSPVRMVKADRRQLSKQKNWRMCFPCWKF